MAENVFEAVKQSVSTREAAEFYGIKVSRTGMACCPFHDDKNPSMKVDQRFHCFGCGADGDVIDFIAKLFNLSPKEAAEKLAQDFGLIYDSQAPPRRRYVRQKTEAQKFREDRQRCYRVLSDYYYLLKKWEADRSPRTLEEEPHPRFVEAIQKKAYAKQQKFDLIVTREVCRFARNTVDALVCVRQLAAIGIEVYFVNDNIWTLDGDGELRLTIMATMAQEESRKISERSLAGQRVSREKGVLYGNGNIFGYTRNKLTKQFEIDPDQAETVKMIFDLYDSGMGETLVAKELTRLGRKNGVGKVKWDAGKVSKIIKRKNYLGYTVYCQSYSNNYLEQKRIKRDESEFVYVKGGFPQIISEEQYERCNAIRRSRTKRLTDEKGRTRSFGIQQAQNVWGRKMRCRCGSPMLRHRWRTNNAGKPIYGYECKRHHDTPRIRLQNEQGNPTPICEIKPVGQSKLELMASQIFERVWGDQREIVLQTCKMLDACYKPDADRRADLMKAKDDSVQLLQQQLDDLVVVRARGEIEQDKFLQRTIEIQQQMEALRQSKAQIASEDYNPGRLDMEAIEAALCEAVEMHDGLVSEDFIDLFVSQVTPLSDSRFAWCLDFSPQPTVAFLNLAGQRKYTNCSMDSKLHFGPFADEEGHTIPFPGSLRR